MSDCDSLEFSLITDQLRWTVGLLSISSMEWANLQGWGSFFSSMQTPSSVFPVFHCFSIWLFFFSSLLLSKSPFPLAKTYLSRKCLCMWSLAYWLKGGKGKFLLRLVTCPHQDLITWPITRRSQWLYVTARVSLKLPLASIAIRTPPPPPPTG